MYKKNFLLPLLVVFTFSVATEPSNNKNYNQNYKKHTLEQKIDQMGALELGKATPVREANIKALEKGLMIKSQIDVARKTESIGKEPMIPSYGSRDHCDEGYVDDCSGDEDCCPESWIGDGLADCEDQPWGCDLSCYENDGGDCAGEGDGGTDGGETDGGDDGGTGGGDGGGACAGNESYIADGWCDDINNNADCAWDGGDCCESTCVDAAYSCDEYGGCIGDCLDPDGNDDACDTDDGGTDGGDDGGECQNFDCMDQCYDGYEDWQGDGYCDDGSWGLYFNCEEFECDYGDCLNEAGECAGNTDGGDDGGEEGCADDQFTCDDGSCIPASWECDVDWCDCADCEDEEDCEGSDDGGTDGGDDGGEGCEDGFVDDCSGDGDCCPEAWIGDGLFDCEDPNNYGCDLTCYDNDGGDCDETGDDGGDGGTDGGEGCEDGQVNDCSGDGDCCPESWIGDGFADCEDQSWGCDLSCYENDGGDCSDTGDTDGGDDGGDDGGWETDVAVIIGYGSSVPGGEVDVSLFVESVESISGIQFTLNADPSDWQTVTDFSASSMSTVEGCWEADFNNTPNGTIGLLYSLSGCEISPSDESMEIGTLTFAISENAEWGGAIELYFSNLIVAGSGGESLNAEGYGGEITIGSAGDVNHDGEINVIDAVALIQYILQFDDPTDSQFWASDINEDGSLDILDVVLLIEMILGD